VTGIPIGSPDSHRLWLLSDEHRNQRPDYSTFHEEATARSRAQGGLGRAHQERIVLRRWYDLKRRWARLCCPHYPSAVDWNCPSSGVYNTGMGLTERIAKREVTNSKVEIFDCFCLHW